jgi:hypothetical protein
MRVCRAEDDVYEIRMILDEARQRFDHHLDALVWGKQAEGRNDAMAVEPEAVLVEGWVQKGQIGNAMRDHGDLAGRHLHVTGEDGSAHLGHDDQAR